MKKLFILFVLVISVICCKAQSIRYQDAGPTYRAYALPNITEYSNLLIDTVFTAAKGPIILTATTLTIDNTTYSITSKGAVFTDSSNFYWQTLTLNNTITCTLRRYTNYMLMDLILLPDANKLICYYIR